MWGGRFAEGPAAIMREINASIPFDKALWRQDITASKAHVAMLGAQGIVSAEDAATISAGLDQVAAEYAANGVPENWDLEDIHMTTESRLAELVGPVAGRLHTARSRNDQVATDFRLWVREACANAEAGLTALQRALVTRAGDHAESIMPGFTHLQTAQPVTLGHHLMAYVEMTSRDVSRFADARARMDQCPLGAAALAGTAFPIDRHYTAAQLGFSAPTENSMDSVGSRDHIAEFLFCCSMLAVHLSRINEEITLWCSEGFRFISLSDAFTTGSSIMPQKRNPDAAELVRGKTGRVVGSLTAILMTIKGLPMTFMKDMQEDKEPMLDAVETVLVCVEATTGMVRDLTVRPAQMRAFLNRGFPTATDLADWLVREAGAPFRDAHHITARIVAIAEARGCTLSELDLSSMREVDPRISADVYAVLSPEASVDSRRSYGGAAPDVVREAIQRARQRWLS